MPQHYFNDLLGNGQGEPTLGEVTYPLGGSPEVQAQINRSLVGKYPGISQGWMPMPEGESRAFRRQSVGDSFGTPALEAQFGLRDVLLPPNPRGIPEDIQRHRTWLTENRGKYPLVDLGADPRRLATGGWRTNKAVGWHRPLGSRNVPAKAEVIRRGRRPYLKDQTDVVYARLFKRQPKKGLWPENLDVINHEFTHRAIGMLKSKEGSKYLLDKDKGGKGRLPYIKVETGKGKYKALGNEAWTRLSMVIVSGLGSADYPNNEAFFRKKYNIRLDELLNDPGVFKGLQQLNKAADLFRQSMGFPRGLTHHQSDKQLEIRPEERSISGKYIKEKSRAKK